jgi:hypothetical protein
MIPGVKNLPYRQEFPRCFGIVAMSETKIREVGDATH